MDILSNKYLKYLAVIGGTKLVIDCTTKIDPLEFK